MGYHPAQEELMADLVLYNTCTIRDSAEQKVYSYLGRQAIRKKSNPSLMHEFGYGGKWWEMVGNGGNFFTYIHELIPTWGGTPPIKAVFLDFGHGGQNCCVAKILATIF